MKRIELIQADVWVDTMPVQSITGKRLYVFVELNSSNYSMHFMKRISPLAANPKLLMLEINARISDRSINNPQSITYTEGLQEDDQISEVEIYFDGKIVAHIKSIPII